MSRDVVLGGAGWIDSDVNPSATPLPSQAVLSAQQRSSANSAITAQTPSSTRIGVVDELRGLAALLVVFQHIAGYYIVALKDSSDPWSLGFLWLTDWLEVGKIGVVLFFAVSGYVIPSSFSGQRNPLTQFVVSRCFRLYPVYWLSIVVGGWYLWSHAGLKLDTGTILANITMLQAVLGKPDIIGVYWTLFIELVFYMVCIGMFLAGKLKWLPTHWLLAVSFLGVSLVLGFLRYQTHSKLPVALSMALSVMAWSYVWRQAQASKSAAAVMLSKRYLAIYFTLAPVICLLSYNFHTRFNENWYRYLIVYWSAMCIFLLATSRPWKENHVLRFVGKISYSLYLFHGIVIHVFLRHLTFGMEDVLRVPTAVLCSLLAAYVGFKVVEEPCIEFGSRVRARINAWHSSSSESGRGAGDACALDWISRSLRNNPQ